MLCPEGDEPAYRTAGASLFIRSLADLPTLIGELRERTR
jgi:hypothetical protein